MYGQHPRPMPEPVTPALAGAKMAMVPALAGTMGQWRLGWNPDGGAYCSLCN
jgi:hypothetical protein